MVKEVPDYPAVPDVEMEEYLRTQAERQASRAGFDRQRAAYFAEKAQPASVPAGPVAPGAPAGADASDRSPVAPQPTKPATLPKPRASQTVPEARPTQRKPPARAGLPVDAPKPAARAARGGS
jgi:hypothetical protein